MAAEIFAGISAFKTMFDVAKSITGMSEAAAVNAAVIELQGKILEAQVAYQEQVEEIQELRAKLDRYNSWEDERARYRLEELPPGVFLYALDPEAANGEPLHYICPNCYQSNSKSILQKTRVTNGVTYWECSGCDFKARTGIPGARQTRVIRG